MAKPTAIKGGRYRNQRQSTPVPVVTIATYRKGKGLTLQDVCDHINAEQAFPKPVERGTISAIENGHRGASAQMLTAIADALGLHAADIDTAYEPRTWRGDVA